MNKSKIVIWTLISVLSLFLLIFAVNEFEIFGIKFWGVRRGNARREVFEQTQSYVESKRQDLVRYRYEWIKADSTNRIAIESVIRMQFANFDAELIQSPELRAFLSSIMH